MATYILNVGAAQFDKGSYAEAQKTLQTVAPNAQYLLPEDQKRLQDLQVRCAAAIAKAAAPAKKEAAATGAPKPNGAAAPASNSSPRPKPAAEPNSTAVRAVPAAGALTIEQQRAEQLYVRGVDLYTQGNWQEARRNFVEVQQSGAYDAPEGRKPQDYIATIDKLTASPLPLKPGVPLPGTAMTPAVPSRTTEPNQVASASLSSDQNTFINNVNYTRNMRLSHTDAVVNDAINQAQRQNAAGNFDQAREPVFNAQLVVNQYRTDLGEPAFKKYSDRLTSTMGDIDRAEADKKKNLEQQRTTEVEQVRLQARKQADTDHDKRVRELLDRANEYWKLQKYDAALGQVEAVLVIDPLNNEALTLKQTLDDTIYQRADVALKAQANRERAKSLQGASEAMIPYSGEVTYPKNWRELTDSKFRQPDKAMELDPENVKVAEQLEEKVDMNDLTPEMPFGAAIESIRNKVKPPLNITVIWRNLQDSGGVGPDTPIQMEGLHRVRLRSALENVLRAVTPSDQSTNPVSYQLEKGVITVAMKDDLPPTSMEVRVYDISDLAAAPSSGGMMGGMGGMGMGGMGMGGMGMMGGMGGGYGSMGGMGGMGGGYGSMGGMSGMGGGYGSMGGMGGMGGGYGSMGGMGGMGGGYGSMGGMGGMGGGYGSMGGMGGGYGSMGGMGGGYGSMGGMGGGYGSMGGMGGGYGSMGGMGGMGMMGGGMSSGPMMAMNLTNLIEQTIDPEGWYDNYPDTALGSITLYPQTTPKKMAVMQTAEVHNQIAKLLVELRRALGTQVSIEARFLTVGENFMQDIGLDLDFTNNFGGKWGVVSFQQDSASNSGPESTKVPGTLGGITPAMSITGAYGTVLDDLQVTYLLHMTQARTDARTLTAPRATVISGEPVTFSVSDTIYYTTPGSLTSVLVPGLTAGSTTTPTIPPPGSYSIGPMLMLTPTVMADKKNVLLNMQQATLTEFLGMQTLVQPTVTGTTTGTGTTGTTGGAVQNVVYQMPQIETTSLTTRVSVPDGGTLLLGGQRIAAESKKEVGVPILSKIPIIGKLFSNTSTVKDTRVLLILVKPTIILQEEREAEALGSVEGNNSSTATTQK